LHRSIAHLFLDNNADISLSADAVWDHFSNILDVTKTGIETASLLTYIFQIAISSRHGPVFVLLCLGKPFMGFFARRSLWEKGEVVLHELSWMFD
jgi:hypothetical protein